MSTPAVKRRRIDVATSTLSKPFRSPLKSPLKAQDSTSDGTTLPSSPAPLETSAFIPSEKTPSIDSPIVTPRRILGNKNTLSPPLSTTVKLNTDPEIAQMLRTQRDLEKQLRDVKEQLETAKQAAKIERESRKTNAEGEIDGELEVLIEKWMGASRQAAEELFGKVRDRVNRHVFDISLTLIKMANDGIGWVALEHGKKCRRSSTSSTTRGTRKIKRAITHMKPIKRIMMLRRGIYTPSMALMRRPRLRNRNVQMVLETLGRCLDRKMWVFGTLEV
jgi:hypothetical protein